jgi:peptidoglycan/LPS O-acetylase OafA/YrhL
MSLGYLGIGLGISATPRCALEWLALSFVWAQHQAFVLDWGDYYGSWAAWSLSYSVGAAIYWMPVEVPKSNGWAGDIAFPLFLCHSLVLALFRWHGWPPGWPLFFAALGPTLALSWLLVVAVERPVQTFRQQLRANHGN